MTKTKIIAFEGIDGTGKSVQMEALKRRLEERGLRVGTLSFPDYGSFFGGCVGRYLMKKDGVSASDVDQRSMALWFAMDRWAAFQGFDYGDLDVLLINRYVLSNAVYQSIRDRDVDKPDILDFVLERNPCGAPDMQDDKDEHGDEHKGRHCRKELAPDDDSRRDAANLVADDTFPDEVGEHPVCIVDGHVVQGLANVVVGE